MSKKKEGPTPGKRNPRRGKMKVRGLVRIKALVPGKKHLNFLKQLVWKKKKAARRLARLQRKGS